jgi:hypothetical protein
MHLHPREFCDFDFKMVFGACGVCDSLSQESYRGVLHVIQQGCTQIIDPVEMELNEAQTVWLATPYKIPQQSI